MLDSEAVAAFSGDRHPKRRRVLSYLTVVASRKRRAIDMRLVVPTTVRVEAGWDRTSPDWAFANSQRVGDDVLTRERANNGARIREAWGLSVADCHLGSLVQALEDDVAVITSDRGDIERAAAPRRIAMLEI